MRFLTAIATLLPLVFGLNNIPHVLNSDVLHHELRSWYVDHPHQQPYPPIKGITAYENALITGPLGDILLPTTEQVVYPLVSQPQMPFDVLFNRTHKNREREHHDMIYSAVHSYSFMTFHFMYEIIPKIAEGIPLLKANPNIKLLVWQNANDWIQTLFDIPTSQIVIYDHRTVYSTDMVYVPSPGHTGYTNPYHFTTALTAYRGIPVNSQEAAPYIVYVSRNISAGDRQIANEYELLLALNQSSPYPVVVFTGTEKPWEIIDIFQGAKAIIGFHGAGLVNAMFSAPNTPIIEMMFTHEPHWDFQHLAQALDLTYWLVPVPQSVWIQSYVTVPVPQVIATLTTALDLSQPCPAGFMMQSNDTCKACGVGHMGDGGRACWRCPQGWYASDGEANPTCHICPLNTIASQDASTCISCPQGQATVLPGANECMDMQTAETTRDSINPITDIVRKMQPPSNANLSYRQALTEWEWTVIGRDTEAYGVPESNARWRSLIEGNCVPNPYVPCIVPVVVPPITTNLTLSFNGVDYVTLAADPVRLQAFNDTVRSSIASSLDIPVERVSIIGIRPGSVIVDVVIFSNTSNTTVTVSEITFPKEFLDTYGVTDVSVNGEPLPLSTTKDDDNGLSFGAKLGLGLGFGLGGLLVVVAVIGFVVHKRKSQRVSPV